jgi:hypothetical protein
VLAFTRSDYRLSLAYLVDQVDQPVGRLDPRIQFSLLDCIRITLGSNRANIQRWQELNL